MYVQQNEYSKIIFAIFHQPYTGIALYNKCTILDMHITLSTYVS